MSIFWFLLGLGVGIVSLTAAVVSIGLYFKKHPDRMIEKGYQYVRSASKSNAGRVPKDVS